MESHKTEGVREYLPKVICLEVDVIGARADYMARGSIRSAVLHSFSCTTSGGMI